MRSSSSTFAKRLSDDPKRLSEHLHAILESESYQRAHQDAALLESDSMRGVRILLEITKPQSFLSDYQIESTVLVFGGVHFVSHAAAQQRLDQANNALGLDP